MCREVYSDLNKDDDGDGWTENQGDMDDSDPYVYPGAGAGNGTNGDNDLDDDPDISVDAVQVRDYTNNGGWQHSIGAHLSWNESFQIKVRARVCNESQLEAKEIDSDYRIEDHKSFDDDDTKVDEDSEFDLDSGECVDKHSGVITIKVIDNGQRVLVSGPKGGETFNVNDHHVKIYFFSDMEEKGRSNGDSDISSETNHDEYGTVGVTVEEPEINTDFSMNVDSGASPLTIHFTNQSTGPITERVWYFGDTTVSTELNPTHTFTDAGVYEVVLVEKNFSHSASRRRLVVAITPEIYSRRLSENLKRQLFLWLDRNRRAREQQ
jgi:hypothetical protein